MRSLIRNNMGNSEQNQKAEIETNPIGSELEIEVSIPEKFEIKMVDASSLNDYELWGAITSVICNFLVGFLVAAISNTVTERSIVLWCITGIFSVFLIFAGYMTYKKRELMTIKKKTIKMGVTKN